MSKIKKFFEKAKNAFDKELLKKAGRTFLYAFLATTIVGYLGWLNDLTAWASSNGQNPFPNAENLTYVTVSGVSAGAIAIVNGLGIWLENMTGHAPLRDVKPVPPSLT